MIIADSHKQWLFPNFGMEQAVLFSNLCPIKTRLHT